MEGRKQNIDAATLHAELKYRVGRVFGRNSIFAGVHVFTNSGDVPDDYGSGPRLVVLSPSEAYSKLDSEKAVVAAGEILSSR